MKQSVRCDLYCSDTKFVWGVFFQIRLRKQSIGLYDMIKKLVVTAVSGDNLYCLYSS